MDVTHQYTSLIRREIETRIGSHHSQNLNGLGPLSLANVVGNSTLPVVTAVVDRVVIVGRGTGGQLLAILPEEIRRVAGGGQGGLLPLERVTAVVVLDTVLLKQTGLSSSLADFGVGFNPGVSPGVVRNSPYYQLV
jgi:hypothetical protein